MRPGVFLDRDGVLIRNRQDHVAYADEVEFLPGALEAVAALTRAGWPIVLWSNQGSAVRRAGLDVVQATFDYVVAKMYESGGIVFTDYSCFHSREENCWCRKPSPHLLWKAAGCLDLDMRASWVVEDWPCNLQAADVVGAKGIFVMCGRGNRNDASGRWRIAKDLAEAVGVISGAQA